MKVLIIGGNGMLGHKLYETLKANDHDVHVTLKMGHSHAQRLGITEHIRMADCYFNTDVGLPVRLEEVIRHAKPDAIVNCCGIVKQRPQANDPLSSVRVNSVAPQLMARTASKLQIRFIHISTDCVFSGTGGPYTEDSPTDAHDIYGKSKALGEVWNVPEAVTLRTSIIGLELGRQQGLIEWFLNEAKNKPLEVRGFVGVNYTGLTTAELSRVIEWVLNEHHGLTGLYQVASDPITKNALISTLNLKANLGAQIVADYQERENRVLIGEQFNLRTGYIAPRWGAMLDELAQEVKARG